MERLELNRPRSPWLKRALPLTVLALLVVSITAVPAQEPNAAEAETTTQTPTTDQPASQQQPPSEPGTETPKPTPPEADGNAATAANTTQQPPTEQSPKPAPSVERTPKKAKSYGLYVLLPAAVAILLAIFTRQVVPAIFLGVLAGAYMLVPCLANDHAFADQYSIIAGFRLAVETYVLGAVLDPYHMKIIIFTLMIGFTVGVIGVNGGTAGMVNLVAGKTESPRRGALTAWAAGLVVFFDDYANTMIVGPTMRSVFDKLRLSRAKLAYIVDSTAAPVASLALIGTWVGMEVGYINDGLTEVAAAGAPEFLMTDSGQIMNGMQAFICSLPYRFYPILALFLVFLTALTGRDFGPMKKSESRAISKVDTPPVSTSEDGEPGRRSDDLQPRWWLGLAPILMLVGATITVLVVSGYRSEDTVAVMNAVGPDGTLSWAAKPWWERASEIIGNGDSYTSIYYGAFLAALTAVVLTLLARAGSVRNAADAGLDGMARMFPAVVILVLAWALSSVQQHLQLGDIVSERLSNAGYAAQWLPLSVFISSALISFATGSSWGTIGIMCPATVVIAVRLIAPEASLDTAAAQSLFYASVGSVLAGSVFGDHCSPISDTTVLSSIASGCPHEEHVWTQIPYAVVAAVAAMGLGDVMCSVYKQPWYLGLGAGAVFLLLFIFIVGRKAKANLAYATE